MQRDRPPLQLTVDGTAVDVPDRGQSLLALLREDLGIRSPKDGCSPQGQCGCCTVLVDGEPRVSCVTPARRVRGRVVTTFEGLEPERRDLWTEAVAATGASQCGFCTPGILCRFERTARAGGDRAAATQDLLAHLCRCTGWQPLLDAFDRVAQGTPSVDTAGRDLAAASRRATLEGGRPQAVGTDVAAGRAPFAADTAPRDSLVAVPDVDGDWHVGETLDAARAAAGKVQGRRTTMPATPPLELPDGAPDDAVTLRTVWTEPGYLETDASWCEPGGEPSDPLANGGAFGAKTSSPAPAAARRLADRHGRPVLALLGREDTVRLGPKRPPVAGWVAPDGAGRLAVVATPGVSELVASVAPGLLVEEHRVAGPPTSLDLRAAGWLEPLLLVRAATGRVGDWVEIGGGRARASLRDGVIGIEVDAGEPLDEVVLRSYVVGAAHFGWSTVTSESLAVDDGTPVDLTVRSFGIVRAVELPPIEVRIEATGRPAVAVSDAVVAAVAELAWSLSGWSPSWPTGGMLSP